MNFEYDDPLRELIAKRDAEIQAIHVKYGPLFHKLVADQQRRRNAPSENKYKGFPRLANYQGDNND